MAVFTSIGAAVATATGLAWLGTATAAALQIAAGVAVSLIGKAMQGEPQAPRFGVQGQVQTGDDVPRSILFGWNCTAGSKAYQNEWGSGGTMSTRVLALTDYPIRELRQVIVDGSPVTLLTAQAHPQYGWPVQEYRKGGKDHLWIKFYDGTQTAADPFLVNTVSSPERPYSSSRVGRGIPYVIATSRAPERSDDEEKPLFQGFPQFKFASYGARLYDPSRDSSVGGSGTQRWDYPATWGGDGDFLPPVQIYNLLRGIRFNGQWLYGLQNVNAARVPVANWIAAINRARAAITTPDGNEPTFRAGGEVQVGAPVHLAIEAFVTACNGRIAETGGTYKLHVGEPGAPVMAFDDGDIISTEEQTFTPFYSLADTVNGVSASYPNPAEGWNTKTAPKLLRPDLETLDGNRRLLASLAFDMVPYTWQVQRLRAWALAEALRARRHTFVLGPEFRVLEPGDVVRWTSERNGYVDKLFRVDGLVYKSDLDVIVDLTEVDPSDYDPDITYKPVYNGPLQLVGPQPMPMQGWQVFPSEILDELGRARRPSIEVRAASGVSNVERVRVQVRVGDETGPLVFDSDGQPYGDPWRWILQGQFLPKTPYVVRGIFVGPEVSQWSGWLAVMTPDVRFGPDDLTIDLANIAKDVLGQLGLKPRELIEQFKQLGTLLEEVDRENYTKREALFREITVELEGLEASFTEIIEVALGPGGAIAQALESLYAAMGGNTAEVNIRWEAQAAPEGYSARYAIQAAVNDGSFRAATMFLDVPANPAQPTRVGFMADNTAFFLSDGTPVALFDHNGDLRNPTGTVRISMLQDGGGAFSFG